jgi:PST family polysaccharide transporter
LPRLLRLGVSIAVCLTIYLVVVVGLFKVTQPLKLGISLLRDFGVAKGNG